MLGETGQFNILTAYHILNYDRLLYNHINNLEDKRKEKLNNLFKSKGITDRKTDRIKITADYAHEYMYIFSERDYPWKITDKNKWLFDELCKKLKYISENNNSVLLKNPHDFSNFVFIKKLYPNAKFIFIHRNPLQVISSMKRYWQTVLDKNEYIAMFSKQYRFIINNPLALFTYRILFTSKISIGIFYLIQRCTKGTEYFLKNINLLDEEDYISIKYEDFCKEPNKIISEILTFLHLKSGKDFSNLVQPRKLSLVPEVNVLKKFIFKKMKSYFEYFKYSL